MSEKITFRITDIGDFSDGSLIVSRQRRHYRNAAVIKFKSQSDARKFAQFMKSEMCEFEIIPHPAAAREARNE